MKKGYTQDDIYAVIFKSERERKRRRMQAIVIETVAAHRLKNMREFLAYQEPATWRRMNGFDRGVEGEESCFNGHRLLPPTPQEYYAGLWSEGNALKAAFSMPAEDTMTRPWQKTIDFVDGLKGKLPEEELAVIKEYVEKRSHEAVKVQVTVTQVNTVQHSSLCPLDSEPSPRVNIELENAEGKMGPELEELEPSSASTVLETPGQQCPPNEGIWETGRTTEAGFLTAAVGSSQGGRISPTAECVDTRASEKSTRITADTTFLQQGHKTFSEQNKQFDPGGRTEKAPLWNAAVALLSFPAESWEASCLYFVCFFCLCPVCVCFPNYFSFQVILTQQAESHEGRRGSRIKSMKYAT